MNEQIQNLKDKIWADEYWTKPNTDKLLPAQLNRFAELIVRECVEQLRYTVLDTQELRRDKSTDYQVGWEDGMFDAEEMIKEHFGVKS